MRILKKSILVVGFVFAFVITLTYFMQEKLIFLPTKLPLDYVYNFEHSFEEFFVETGDGARLNAIHFKTENPKGVILYFHGNAGDLSRWGVITSYFTQFDYDVVVMDYRTYGKSNGKLSEKALLTDAQLFYNYLLKKFQEDEIIVYGRSLGTNLAVFVASANNPKGLILETPFYSMEDVAKSRFPILPVKYLLKYKFKTHNYIGDVNCPITIFHGTDDAVVPIESCKKLTAIIPAEQLDFVVIPRGNHNNLMEFPAYQEKIDKLLN